MLLRALGYTALPHRPPHQSAQTLLLSLQRKELKTSLSSLTTMSHCSSLHSAVLLQVFSWSTTFSGKMEVLCPRGYSLTLLIWSLKAFPWSLTRDLYPISTKRLILLVWLAFLTLTLGLHLYLWWPILQTSRRPGPTLYSVSQFLHQLSWTLKMAR